MAILLIHVEYTEKRYYKASTAGRQEQDVGMLRVAGKV